jgi:ribosome production factor 2
MAQKKSSKRKALLSIVTNERSREMQREIATIRGDSVELVEHINAYTDTDVTERLLRRKQCGLFLSINKEMYLSFGRCFNDEIIDMVEFRISRHRPVSDFGPLGPALHSRYFVLLQNIDNERLANLVVDLLNKRGNKICLDGVRHAWIFSRTEKRYLLKYVRILNDQSIEDCGPYFELELVRSYHCTEEKYQEALDLPKKSNKISKNELKDKIGRVYLEKQDLKDVKLRKGKAGRNKGTKIEG